MRPARLALVAATLLAPSLAFARTDPLSHVNELPPALESKVGAVAAALEDRGFEVARGYWKTFDIEDCKWAIAVIGNCYGNNPAAPYVVPVLPPWRDEYVDVHTHLAFGPVHRGNVGSYRLAEREAIVVLAKLPPKAAYFGLQTYVFTRKDTIDPHDAVYERIERSAPDMLDLLFDTAPDPSRVVVFSSIGNSINDVVMGRPGEPAWEQERFIVITPDAAMREAVTAALRRADPGISTDQVFVEPVSPGVVRLGLGPEADDLISLVRYAMPDPEVETEAARWRRELPLAVLRVRDLDASHALAPYDPPAYEERTAESEQWLAPDLRTLVQAVKDDWGRPEACHKGFVVPYLDIDLLGQHCLQRPMNCLGDTQDNDTYRISQPFTIDPPGATVAVVGSLATATGNATYVSLSVNRFAVLQGVTNYSHLELAGSAREFSVPNHDRLYAFYLSRRCPPQTRAPCFEISEKEVPTGEAIKVMQRNYIKPGTARGPDPGTPDDLETPEDERTGRELLLRPQLIWLDPPGCPP